MVRLDNAMIELLNKTKSTTPKIKMTVQEKQTSEDISSIKIGDFPANHVSLLEGIPQLNLCYRTRVLGGHGPSCNRKGGVHSKKICHNCHNMWTSKNDLSGGFRFQPI